MSKNYCSEHEVKQNITKKSNLSRKNAGLLGLSKEGLKLFLI